MLCNQKIGVLNSKDLCFAKQRSSNEKGLPGEIIFHREAFLFIKLSVYQKLYPTRRAKMGWDNLQSTSFQDLRILYLNSKPTLN